MDRCIGCTGQPDHFGTERNCLCVAVEKYAAKEAGLAILEAAEEYERLGRWLVNWGRGGG